MYFLGIAQKIFGFLDEGVLTPVWGKSFKRDLTPFLPYPI